MYSAGSLHKTFVKLAWLGSIIAIALSLILIINSNSARALASAHEWPRLPTKKVGLITIGEWGAIQDLDNLVLIDIRDRRHFAQGSLLGARNIPMYEVDMRASREIPKNSKIVIYCGYDEDCERKFRLARHPTPCMDISALLTDKLGYNDVHILAATEAQLIEKGAIFVSSNYDLIHEELNS